MKFCVAVLIAAVTVNCLVTAINGEAANDTAAVPYIDMLLPPFEDVQDNSKDAATKNNSTAKVTPVSTTKTATTTTSTKKPITNEVHNILPVLSIEALLPPLFEAKTEQEETKKSTTQKPTTTTTTTTATTRRPITTTIKTTTTDNPATTTTKTTTVRPSKIAVPELFLDSLLPPLLDNDIVNTKEEKVAVTTQKPSLSYKTTKKSYYQQQQTQQLRDQKQPQLKHLQANTSKDVKNYNKPVSSTSAADKHVAESKTQTKPVPLKQVNKLQSKIESMTKQHVAKQKVQQRQHEDKQFNNNYSFDLFFGSTTARPAKSGLPTITPFPHRLGR